MQSWPSRYSRKYHWASRAGLEGRTSESNPVPAQHRASVSRSQAHQGASTEGLSNTHAALWGEVKVLIALMLVCTANAQESSFRHENRFTIPAFLALQASDAYATDRGFNTGHWVEHNPIIPSSRSGRIAYFSATAAAVILTGYILHKTNHHKAERALMLGAIGTEAYSSAHSWIGQR